MRKETKNVTNRLPMHSKTAFKTWLIITSAIFFFPFIGIFINEITSIYICDLYTLGLDRKDFFTVWIALFGAIGIAFNIHQNHKRTANQDKQLEKQAQQIELQSKSQRDSRFSKGVELLGNANESARTGAAYSLFFLAQDYPEEFAKPVFEILCSHVRSITNTEEYRKNNNERPSNEIQSILDLLFTNDQSKLIFNGLRANLAYSCLIGANLARANLSEADLFEANLSKANLAKADLSKAYLSEASLLGVYLGYSYLIGANLLGANLLGAGLAKADLAGADLAGANLLGANLSGANLSGASLLGANLPKADLLEANLAGANLLGANLAKADLSGIDLSKAYLSGVDLSGAKTDNTRFSVRTILEKTDLSHIDFTKTKGRINPKYLNNPDNKTNVDSQ
ncbi:pentapeptide repeat-containing protein [uncultured Bacteroides sp.]|uniref:pentapeptide repeat-containing protein n=1 Tax=uncultured Bacteroides sp. TaxID=162156 RepID=UPI002AAAFAD9|nr:pentapeptide repeat-containing protein [uncultured Bacteroides sp.]